MKRIFRSHHPCKSPRRSRPVRPPAARNTVVGDSFCPLETVRSSRYTVLRSSLNSLNLKNSKYHSQCQESNLKDGSREDPLPVLGFLFPIVIITIIIIIKNPVLCNYGEDLVWGILASLPRPQPCTPTPVGIPFRPAADGT